VVVGRGDGAADAMSFQFISALNTRLNSPWFCQR
jgi:hypothetical protein